MTTHDLHAQPISTLGPLVGRAELKVLRNFAFGHWRGAHRLAKMLAQHEEAHAGEEFGPQFEDARSFATAAILMAHAGIEAGVYELQLGLGTPENLRREIEKKKLFERLSTTLIHHGKPAFPAGDKLGQRVRLLTRIRNSLAHAKAEWSNETRMHVSLSEEITSAKLRLNPFLPVGSPVFPLGIMSAGVAQWAADCAKDFLFDIRARADLQPFMTGREKGIDE